jgi:hypothetical protein
LAVAVAGFLLLTAASAKSQPDAIPPDRICAHAGPPFVGPCYTIHGDLIAGGDNIQIRLHPKGTERILGYADGALRCSLPRGLEDTLAKAQVAEADVTIRPVTKSRPGVMQFVCIASVKNMRIKR